MIAGKGITAGKMMGLGGAALAALFAAAQTASAETIHDLTTLNSSYSDSQGALFIQNVTQPAGTGYVQSFLRTQKNGEEQGFNTDADGQLDDKTGNFTHSLLLNTLNTSVIGGVEYYGFYLDINQEDHSPLLSLNKLQIFTTNDANIQDYHSLSVDNTTGLPTDGFSTAADLVYDLDGQTDNYIELNYNLAGGSGQADMLFYVRKSLFNGKIGDHVVLYNSFVKPSESNDGFEEWYTAPSTGGGTTGEPPPEAPLPSTAVAGMTLLGGLGLLQVRRSRRAAV